MSLQQSAFESGLREKLGYSHIPALHGIRAIAVFLVIFYHAGIPLVPGGHGVLMFFVLSGFLITWLLLRENEKSGQISLSGFYKRRMLRIFPAFYCYWVLLIGLLLLLNKNVPWPHAVSSFFYLTNYYNAINGDPATGFSHTWSLAIEEQFYLLWPFLFARFRRDLRKMTIFLAALIGCVWVYRCILYFVFGIGQGYFYEAFDTRIDGLMAGCLLAVLLKRGVLMSLWSRACSSVALLGLTLSLFFASAIFGPLLIPRYRDLIGLAIDPLIVVVMIVQMIALSSSPYLRWLQWPVTLYLGEISYSLYLWQQLTLDLTRHLSSLPLPIRLAAGIAFTILMASLSYRFIEKPFLRLKNRKTERAVADQSQSPDAAAAPGTEKRFRVSWKGNNG